MVIDAVNGGLRPCEPGRIAVGQLCEGDGPCGTSDVVDNCGYSAQSDAAHLQRYDLYVRLACSVAFGCEEAYWGLLAAIG